MMQFLFAKRYSLAIAFFHYLSLVLYGINYIKGFLFINILGLKDIPGQFFIVLIRI